MLRVRTIFASAAASAANYYTRYLIEAPGEVAGVWAGDQAAALGLTGDVDGADLSALLEGRDPVSATPLGRPLEDRYRAAGTPVRAVAGFDATFSAPKSVSVLWALTQDDALLAAHDTAVRAALAHLERFGSTTRVRADGWRLHPDSQGLITAAFRQTTSRSDDPQLHTHVVISSKVQTADGRWLALDARYLKKYQRMLGGVYQSVLRNELTHQLGVAWGPIVNGQAEMLGIPAEVIEQFSKRSEQIELAIEHKVAEFAGRRGRDPNQWELAAIKREAAVDTRGATGRPRRQAHHSERRTRRRQTTPRPTGPRSRPRHEPSTARSDESAPPATRRSAPAAASVALPAAKHSPPNSSSTRLSNANTTSKPPLRRPSRGQPGGRQSARTRSVARHRRHARQDSRRPRSHSGGLAAALDDWHEWATGRHQRPSRVDQMISVLSERAVDKLPECQPLAVVARWWAITQGIDLTVDRLHPAPTPDLEIEL